MRRRRHGYVGIVAAFLLSGLSFMQASPAAAGADRILVFWRADCAPCLIELEALPKIAAAHPDLRITLVALQDDGRGADAIARDPHENLQLEEPDGDPAALLAHYGNLRRMLPYSVALSSDGTICATRYGLLGTALVESWVESC